MYFSVASRTTHASDTFFCLAIPSRVSYISDGKLIVARIDDVRSDLLARTRLFPFIMISPHFTTSVNEKTSPLAGCYAQSGIDLDPEGSPSSMIQSSSRFVGVLRLPRLRSTSFHG
jgi:hypothetical protein